MASSFKIAVPDGAEKVHRFLAGKLSHLDGVSEDVIRKDDQYVAILVYQHYFSRVGNQVALVVIIWGGPQRCTVKSISCGASRGLFGLFDWGASHDFASEPMGYLESKYNL